MKVRSFLLLYNCKFNITKNGQMVNRNRNTPETVLLKFLRLQQTDDTKVEKNLSVNLSRRDKVPTFL